VSAPTRSAVLFGGSGFIGRHLVDGLVGRGFSEIVVADLRSPACPCPQKLEFVLCDVRTSIDVDLAGTSPLVVNLAAIHRTPGHEDHEYLDTNIKGAQNVVDFASRIESTHIWFTSSIAVYDSIAARVAHTLGVQDLNPERVTKLVRSTNIVPQFLNQHDYRPAYELPAALLDWFESDPPGKFV